MIDIEILYQRLSKRYSGLKSFINYSNHFELTIAVILTAQTTDAQVNKITPELFKKYPDAASLAAADIGDLEEIIRSTGFFKVKAKNIRNCAAMIHRDFHDSIPDKIEELIKLPGVGRKSANVIVGHAYDQPAVAVDTHFGRVAFRLGLTTFKDPVRVEKQVKKYVPPQWQMTISQAVNAHGRQVCHARKPRCESCFLADICAKRGV